MGFGLVLVRVFGVLCRVVKVSEGFLAWGTNLYADSLIIASCEPIHTALMNDPRLDTVQINKETDVLPVSSGD